MGMDKIFFVGEHKEIYNMLDHCQYSNNIAMLQCENNSLSIFGMFTGMRCVILL